MSIAATTSSAWAWWTEGGPGGLLLHKSQLRAVSVQQRRTGKTWEVAAAQPDSGATAGYEAELWATAGANRARRGEEGAGASADIPGFCKKAAPDEVRRYGRVFAPGRYVGVSPREGDGARLMAAIAANLEAPGFGES